MRHSTSHISWRVGLRPSLTSSIFAAPANGIFQKLVKDRPSLETCIGSDWRSWRAPGPTAKKSPIGASTDGATAPSQVTRTTMSRQKLSAPSTAIHRRSMTPGPVSSARVIASLAGSTISPPRSADEARWNSPAVRVVRCPRASEAAGAGAGAAAFFLARAEPGTTAARSAAAMAARWMFMSPPVTPRRTVLAAGGAAAVYPRRRGRGSPGVTRRARPSSPA